MNDAKDGAKAQPGQTDAAHSPKNEGEGSRSAAKQYNDGATAFAQSGKVESQAKAAERALEGPEAEALKRAEEAGQKHSHGEDPALRR